MGNEDWFAHQKLVLFRLDELQKSVDALNNRVCQLRNDVTGLKIKASVGAGVVSLLITLGMHFALK